MARYAIIDATNAVQGVALWDGVTEWSPGPGLTAVPDTALPTAQVGSIYNPSTGAFSVPVQDGE